MKLDCVLTSCNNNPLYIDFIPIFVNTWKKLYPSIDVKIVLVADSIPSEFVDYTDNIILFPPIDGVNDAFISQIIRLVYPAILTYEGAVLITDIDILPMNRTYYSAPLEPLTNDKFVHYRNGVMIWRNIPQYAMCYNAAPPAVWKELVGVNNVDEVRSWIIANNNTSYSGIPDGSGWYSDQAMLYSLLSSWSKKDTHLVILKDNDIGFNRLDRGNIPKIFEILQNVQNLQYSDYHAMRPYKTYKQFNDFIVNCIPSIDK